MKTASATYDLFAIAAPGLEPVVARELAALGAKPKIVPGGVEFSGDARIMYRANLELRTATRVVLRIASFRARTFFELERHAKDIPWKRFVARNGEVALRVSASKSKLYHQGAIAQRVMAAASKAVNARIADSAGNDEEDQAPAGQIFIVRFVRDECVVSVDTSGALLHLRGYRQAVAKAPLRETLAASMLLSSGWNGDTPVTDPMCGSGTIAIEAALIARKIPPGLASAARLPRAYAFEAWPELDAKVWADIVNRARGEILPKSPVSIAASDRDAGAIAAAQSNAQRAGVQDDIAFNKLALSSADVPGPGAWLVTNPPYGVRVGSGDQRNLFASLGRLAREKMPEGRVVLLTPDRSVDRHSGLTLSPVLETRNGGIAVRILAGTPVTAAL